MSFALLEGGAASFANYRRKPLVVNFFASWCTTCLAELPRFEAVHRRLGEKVAWSCPASVDT